MDVKKREAATDAPGKFSKSIETHNWFREHWGNIFHEIKILDHSSYTGKHFDAFLTELMNLSLQNPRTTSMTAISDEADG